MDRTTPARPRSSSRRRNRQSGLRSPGSSFALPAHPIPRRPARLIRGRQHRAQLHARLMNLRLRRAFRYAEEPRHLVVLEALNVVQHERRAAPVGKPGDGPLEIDAADRRRHARCRRGHGVGTFLVQRIGDAGRISPAGPGESPDNGSRLDDRATCPSSSRPGSSPASDGRAGIRPAAGRRLHPRIRPSGTRGCRAGRRARDTVPRMRLRHHAGNRCASSRSTALTSLVGLDGPLAAAGCRGLMGSHLPHRHRRPTAANGS